MLLAASNQASGRTSFPLWQRAALLSLGYFLCAWLGSFLSAPGSTNVSFWLPSGLFVAVLLLNPTRDWPWLVLAVLPANVAFEFVHVQNPKPGLVLFFYLSNVARALLGAWLVRRFVSERPALTTLKEFFGLMAFAGILSALCSGALGAAALVSFGLSRDFFHSWFVWWTGSAMAVLVFAPVLLTWLGRPRIKPFSASKQIEAAALFGGLNFLAWYFLVWGGGVNSPKVPLLIFVLWAGLRFGVRGAALTVFWLSLLMAFLTTHFLKGLSPADIASGNYIVTLQVFLAVAAFVGLIPAIILAERDQTMASLRESEESLRATVENTPYVAVQWYDPQARVAYWNRASEIIYGWPAAEAVGKNLDELIFTREQTTAFEQVLAEIAHTGKPFGPQEFSFRHRDGRLGVVLSTIFQIQVPSGEPRFVCMDVDLTRRKLAEDLSSSQRQVLEMIAGGRPMAQTLDALLRAVEAQSPDMVCSVLLLDADGVHLRHGAAPSLPAEFIQAIDGSAIGLNAGSCGAAAFRREAVFVAEIASDPLWTDYKQFALPHGLRACWSTPIFDAQKNVLGTFAIYYRRPGLPDESHRQLIEMATHTAAVCIGKHRAEQSRRENELRLRLMAELIAGYSFSYTVADGGKVRLEWLSQAGEKVLGYTEAELKSGVSFRGQIHPDDQAGQAASLALVLSGTPEIMEFRFRVKSGKFRWLRCFNRPEKDPVSGQVIRIVGAGQDITDLKLAEQEQAAAIAREQQARISYTLQLISSQEAERKRIAAELHDSMGQNLLLIKNLAQMVSRSQEPAQVYEHIVTINNLATQCLAEARQISRDLHPHQLDHLGLKRALEAMLENAASASTAKFSWKLDDTGEIFSAEAAMNLYRIVQESLNNILKHSRAQNVRVRLERDIHEVVLEIADDGCGFVPGAQMDGKSGMGLRNIAERVRMLAGKLKVDSAADAGTRITVTVPLAGEGEAVDPAV